MDWATISLMVVTLISALFTGNGEVTDEQAAALNAISPGLGAAFQTAVGAANGAAPTYTEWAADTTLLKSLGLLNPFGSPSGPLGNVSRFLSTVNPWLLIGGGVLVVMLLRRGGGGDIRFWKSGSSIDDSYIEV